MRAFNVPRGTFGTSPLSRRCPSRHWQAGQLAKHTSVHSGCRERRFRDIAHVLNGAFMSLSALKAPFRASGMS